MVINTSLLFSWLFHILHHGHLLFFSCSLECPSPECPSCSVLVWASVTRCCSGPSEVELVLQVARAMQCSRRRLRGGEAEHRVYGRAENDLRLKLVRCQGHPGPEHHGAIIVTLGLATCGHSSILLQELTLCRGKLSRSRLSFSVCHARGNSANILIEL